MMVRLKELQMDSNRKPEAFEGTALWLRVRVAGACPQYSFAILIAICDITFPSAMPLSN